MKNSPPTQDVNLFLAVYVWVQRALVEFLKNENIESIDKGVNR